MALYRKYRPATFAEVVGQEHVTEPLSAALEAGRINHAYLFSGPRGCGKTSSARILARSLNCVQGPTASPCGVCNSCVALGPGGAGNLDVIELDAASHGGVEDTRDLRDKAFYAPAESRYRVFIVDEAHMVSPQGFNALLKIVEEPPEHLIFIFATTEPEKVLPTIRSRTHHYPFRLLPPTVMRGLLDTICAQEHVAVEEAVFPLVIRAGGGSPRDSLSVLDQLLAGAGPEGITYPRALSLLGVTDIALIDDSVDALAANDGAALFETVNRLVEAGHDPRRFASDLLERIRDLILMQAVPDAGERGLVDAPVDVIARMREETDRIGPATLTRYAEIIHDGLGEMRGATAPRLLLEVMCARMLLPAASEGQAALMQRLERLERGIPDGGAAAHAGDAPAVTDHEAEPAYVRPSQRATTAPASPPAPQPAAAEAVPAPQVADTASADEMVTPEPSASAQTDVEPVDSVSDARDATAEAEVPAAVEPTQDPVPESAVESAGPPQDPPAAAPVPTEPEQAEAAPVHPDAVAVRAAWPAVRAKIRESSKILEAMLSSAIVRTVDEQTVGMSHESPALAARLVEPHNAQIIEQALEEVFKYTWTLTIVKDTGPAPAGGPPPQTRSAQAAAPKAPTDFQRPSRSPSARMAEPVSAAPVAAVPRPEPRATSPIVITRPSQEGVPPAPQRGESEYPADLPPEPDLPEDTHDGSSEDEMLAEAAAGPDEPTERRDPEEVAIELLETELGAQRIEG